MQHIIFILARRKGRHCLLKIHPFSFVGKDEFYTAGEPLGFMCFCGMSFGESIFKGLRFQQVFSAMAGKIVAYIVIANWAKNASIIGLVC
ncbi:hypothetical protein OAR11_00135 [Alphaproteobacteria bacterium]|nr:hypothetical protein [Alphaproteobacteria bacterium]